MKSLTLIISLLILCTFAQAQNTQKIEAVFNSGNASGLTDQLETDIELCIGNDVLFLSSDQAIKSLNKWFAKNKPTHFSGKIVGGSSVKYYNGTMKSENGSFRIFVYYADKNGAYKIDEIRIVEKNN